MSDLPATLISLGARLRDLAVSRPDKPAVSDKDRTLTWAQLDDRTDRVARGLLKAGVKHGNLVTIGLPNSVDFIEACWGLWKIGATPQPISFRLPRSESDAVMALAETPIVITGSSNAGHRPNYDLAALIALDPGGAPPPDTIAPSWKAPTSGGTTGRPKLIVSGGRGVYLSPDIDPLGAFGINGDDVAIMPGPLYHNGPFVTSVSALNQGAHLVILPRFDAEGTLSTIERHRASWIYMVPTMMSRIWHLPIDIRTKYDVTSLRKLWHMASPCPAWLKEQWINWLGPESIMELYGGTEGQSATTISGFEWLAHRGSVGRPIMGEMRAVDADGNPVPHGEIGEIFMRPMPGNPKTYSYRGAQARVLGDGWESLGDFGWFDEDGYLYLSDRRTDMILVGGVNVYPSEVEGAIEKHPLVQSCAVIGLPDDDMGNLLHAIVQARPGLDEVALRDHLSALVVSYKQPRTYEFVGENVRDDAGKVRRNLLRDERMKRSG